MYPSEAEKQRDPFSKGFPLFFVIGPFLDCLKAGGNFT